MHATLNHVVKHSILYGYLLSQPFATYVDAYPTLQNKILQEAEQIEYNHHGEVVRVLQKKLKILSYYDDEVDGDYGILTEQAIKKFQADHHITISGQTDKETIIALIEVEKDLHLKRLKRLSPSIYPGMVGEDVEVVQEALKYFGYYEGKVDGIYGPLTEKGLEIAEEEQELDLISEEPNISHKSPHNPLEQDEETEEENVSEQEEIEPNNEQDEDEQEQNEQEQVNEIKKVETIQTNHQEVVQVARSFIGTPYVWGGDSPNGFDCSGFIQHVYQTIDITVPRTVNDIWNFSTPVEKASVGDLVFFETYKPGPSHMGIYLGDGKFIHAGLDGVEISELSNSYWQQRYLGAKRIH